MEVTGQLYGQVGLLPEENPGIHGLWGWGGGGDPVWTVSENHSILPKIEARTVLLEASRYNVHALYFVENN